MKVSKSKLYPPSYIKVMVTAPHIKGLRKEWDGHKYNLKQIFAAYTGCDIRYPEKKKYKLSGPKAIKPSQKGTSVIKG